MRAGNAKLKFSEALASLNFNRLRIPNDYQGWKKECMATSDSRDYEQELKFFPATTKTGRSSFPIFDGTSFAIRNLKFEIN